MSQSNIWEPRENRGRLRHCNGLQTPIATGRAKAGPGRRERGYARSQDIGLAVLVVIPPVRDQLLRQEKDEASLANGFRQDSLNAFIPRLAEFEGFL